eukprot:2835355-Rhodomonas_salina.2
MGCGQDLATTQLSVTENTATIDSASIEAGLMTFVMKGNSSYFLQSASTRYGCFRAAGEAAQKQQQEESARC